MAESIKNKFFSGIAWSFIQNFSVRIAGFVFTIILTRTLNPGDYGLIGMLSIFMAISEVFITSGFGGALVQKKDCNDDDFSTAFYFNVAVSVFIYVILFFCAPLIAKFYHEPQLVVLTRVVSLSFVFGSFNIVQSAKLNKAMNFKPLAIISLICTIASGVVGVALAYMGFGVWALVAQGLSSSVLRVIVFPIFTRWHPNRPFNMESFRHLWDFGSKMIVTGVIAVIIRNLSNILIGRYYDKDKVGLFSRSQSLAQIPSETLFSVLYSVSYPAFCECQDDRERWIGVYQKVLFNTVLIVCPISILLALLGEPIVIILLTEKWAACIPIFQALLLARMLVPIGATHTALLRSSGNTTLYMKLYFITGPLSLVAVIAAIPFGVVGMAWATLIGETFAYLIPAFVIGRKYGYTLSQQLWDWRLIFVSLVLMSAGVFAVVYLISNIWLQLIIGGLVGIGVYALCCKLFNLVDETLINLVKTKLKLR